MGNLDTHSQKVYMPNVTSFINDVLVVEVETLQLGLGNLVSHLKFSKQTSTIQLNPSRTGFSDR